MDVRCDEIFDDAVCEVVFYLLCSKFQFSRILTGFRSIKTRKA